MADELANGLLQHCAAAETWKETRIKIADMHNNMSTVNGYLQHLEKLDSLERIEESLVGPATSKDQIETKTAVLIFKLLGSVIVAQWIVLLCALVGKDFVSGLISHFIGK